MLINPIICSTTQRCINCVARRDCPLKTSSLPFSLENYVISNGIEMNMEKLEKNDNAN